MKLIELLQLRSFTMEDKQSAIDLLTGLNLSGMSGELRFFNSPEIRNDLAICIYWNHDFNTRIKSELAHTLSELLKHHGWISHSIWKPLKELSC